MVELQTTFDLLGSISHFVYCQRQQSSNNLSGNNANEPTLITPRIINQEKGGGVIFVWHDGDKEKPGLSVTNFGFYEFETQKHSLIYTYEKKVKVVSCSVNQERTLLAFSISRQRESSEDKKSRDIYEAFLAQLQSVNKVIFSLNMERSTFLKVQFLYPDHQSSQKRESALLVFLHKESVGLYKVRMARIGERGVMMSGQPTTEQIVGKFVWCQWDVQNQRLHYIQNVRRENRTEQISQKLSTIQFYTQAKFENMIDVPINFSFPYIRTADRPHYGDIPLHPGIPDLSLNVSVLTQPTGSFCICYHKLNNEKRRSDNLTPNDSQDVEYYISLVHHVKTLYGCVHNLPRNVVAQKRLVFSWIGSYLAVLLPGCFIHMLNVGPNFEPCHHILLHDSKVNLRDGIELPESRIPESIAESRTVESRTPSRGLSADETDEASPNLIRTQSSVMSVLSTQSPALSLSSESPQTVMSVFSSHCATMKTLLLCQSTVRESGQVAQNLYDYRSGCMIKLVVNIESLIDYFCHAYWQTQMAILHYLILHNKDIYAIRSIFSHLSENTTDPELNILLTEYLIASSYADMKKQVDHEVLSLLPYTSTQTLRGQFEKSQSGERLAHISYLSLEILDLNKKISKDSKLRSSENFWNFLISRIRQHHMEIPPKYTHDMVMRVYHMTEKEEAQGKCLWDAVHVSDSFFDGVNTLKAAELPMSIKRKNRLSRRSESSSQNEDSGGRRSKTESVLGPAPLFLQTRISNESSIFKRRLSVLTEEVLSKHLMKYLKKESRSKSVNVAKEFLACQARVAQQLCHLIWSLRSEFMSDHLEECLLPNLQIPGTNEEYELFQLLEQFYMVVGELGFPLPPGFSSFFTALGFKCLHLHLFLQYVDNHVLSLTPDFILQVLEDLDNDEDKQIIEIKYRIISRLPKPFAKECFERWNHPIILRRKATEQVSNILIQGMEHFEDLENKQRAASTDHTTFQPLSTLKKHLDTVIANIQTDRPVPFEPNLIDRMALYNTETKTAVDMSKVTF